MLTPQKLEEGGLGIRTRHDARGADLLARGQLYPRGPVLAHQDARRRRGGADLRTGGGGRTRQRLGKRPETALRLRERLHALWSGGAVQEREHGAGRARAVVRAEHGIERQRTLEERQAEA